MRQYTIFCDGKPMSDAWVIGLGLQNLTPPYRIPPGTSFETAEDTLLVWASAARGHVFHLADETGAVHRRVLIRPRATDPALMTLTDEQRVAIKEAGGELPPTRMLTWRINYAQYDEVLRQAAASGRSVNQYISFLFGFESQAPTTKPRGRKPKLREV